MIQASRYTRRDWRSEAVTPAQAATIPARIRRLCGSYTPTDWNTPANKGEASDIIGALEGLSGLYLISIYTRSLQYFIDPDDMDLDRFPVREPKAVPQRELNARRRKRIPIELTDSEAFLDLPF